MVKPTRVFDPSSYSASNEIIPAGEMLKQLGIHPKRTVRFIAWMDGEQGAEGVLTYAKEHAKNLLITSRLSNPIRARDILSVFTLWANRTSKKGCARSPRFLSPSEQAL